MYVSSITLEKEKTANRMHASSGYALFIAVESVATTCNYHMHSCAHLKLAVPNRRAQHSYTLILLRHIVVRDTRP